MKAHLAVLAAVGALLGSAGCVTSSRVGQDQLPADWIAALPKPGSPAADLAGVFVERGEQINTRSTRDGKVRGVNLSNLVFLIDPDEAGKPRRPPDRIESVELRPIDATHLELIGRANGDVVHRVTREVEIEKDTGTMVLRHGQSFTSGKALAAVHAQLTLRFWRAADGRLYIHNTGRSIGEVMLLPVLLSTEVWSRWEPATTESLARQAEAGRHAGALNQHRAIVGEPAPVFAGTDVLTGRFIASADYAGKVVLLHVWSTRTASNTLKALRSAYETHHARGLEIVGLCREPAEERDRVLAFAKANGLAWPQLHDGQGTRGGIIEAYYGTRPPRFCVIGRNGVVAALVVSPKDLDAAVAAALATP